MNTTTLLNLVFNLFDQHQWLGYFINILIKSSAILLIVSAITLLLRKYSAAVRHLIWGVSFIGLFFLPLIIIFIPTLELAVSEFEIVLMTDLQGENINRVAQALTESINNWSTLIQALYFIIVFILLAYTFLGICRIHILTLKSQKINSESCQKELQTILDSEEIFSKVGILESDHLTSPISWGLWNPVIILPSHARTWSAEKIRNVLIHEVCHIQRLDWLTHILSRIVSAMYWCNPLVWLAIRKLGEEAEQACDDAVILFGRDQSHYANDLLEIAKNVNPSGTRHILAEAIAHSFLGSRIIAILDSTKVRNKTESIAVIRAFLITSTTILILASVKIVPEIKIAVINQTLDNLISFNYLLPEEIVDKATRDPGIIFDEKPVKETVYIKGLPPLNRDVIGKRVIQNTDNPLSLSEESSLAGPWPVAVISLNNVTENDDPNNLILPLRRTAPVYPEQATRRGIEGYSIVEYEISPEGLVINPIVVESSPGNIFNRASLQAMQNYLYAPPILNGEAIGINGLRTRFVYQLNPKPG